MFIKYYAKNEDFIITCLDDDGNIITNTSINRVSLYNKTDDSYVLIYDYSGDKLQLDFKIDPHLLTDSTKFYVDIYIDSVLYKSKVEIDYTNTIQSILGHLRYTTSAGTRPTNNSYLCRVSLGLPKWATAYKQSISNFSKTFYPVYSLAERNFYMIQEALEDNLTNTIKNSYVTTKKPVSIVKIGSKEIPITHIRDKEMITSITKEKLSIDTPKLFNLTLEELSYPIVLDSIFNKLFIKSDKVCAIKIEGTNTNRLPISETITCNGMMYTGTFNNYKKITSISIVTLLADEEPTIVCSNYLNLQGDQLNFKKDYKITATFDKDKNYDTPVFTYNSDTYSINSFYNNMLMTYGDFEDSYYCPDLKYNKGIFITDDLDVVAISKSFLDKEDSYPLFKEDGTTIQLEEMYKVFISQLRKDLTSTMPIFSSNNNNSIVTVTDDSIMEDNQVQFEVDCNTFINTFGNQEVILYLQVDDTKVYLTNDGKFTSDKTYFRMTNKNTIYIAYSTLDISFVTLVLEYNGISYQGSCIKNLISSKETDISVSNLYHNGDYLVARCHDDYFRLNLNKDYVQLIDDTTVDTKSYDNVTIINKEGIKDGNSITK